MVLELGKSQINGASIIYQAFDRKGLNDPIHVHAMYELVFIERGEGSWQIGARSGAFKGGVLSLCPPKTFHAWLADDCVEISGISLHFSERCLPSSMLHLPEMKAIRELMKAAEFGLLFEVSDSQRLYSRLGSLARPHGALRIARLYAALELMTTYKNFQVAGSQEHESKRKATEIARFEATKRFLREHFTERIGRADAARNANMEEAAFSRFFREASGTTFVDYLANLRIQRAASLLGSRRDLSVPVVAASSGFRDMSAFYRQFKKRLGTTPNAYRASANRELLAP